MAYPRLAVMWGPGPLIAVHFVSSCHEQTRGLSHALVSAPSCLCFAAELGSVKKTFDKLKGAPPMLHRDHPQFAGAAMWAKAYHVRVQRQWKLLDAAQATCAHAHAHTRTRTRTHTHTHAHARTHTLTHTFTHTFTPTPTPTRTPKPTHTHIPTPAR
eukprot:2189198-Pleurochrysis_carterae.AAC.1